MCVLPIFEVRRAGGDFLRVIPAESVVSLPWKLALQHCVCDLFCNSESRSKTQAGNPLLVTRYTVSRSQPTERER